MPVATLAVTGFVKLATCASLVLVGRSLHARSASSGYMRTASNAFVAWWWGIAAYMAIQGAAESLAAFGVAALGEVATVRLLEVPIDAVAVWGIMSYVLMLHFETRHVPLIAGIYAALATAVYAAEALLEPQAVSVTPWSVGLAPAGPTMFYALASALFGVPLLIATLAYAALIFRVHEPLQRYRIGLVSASLFAWVAGGLLATAAGGGWWNFVAVTGLGIIGAGAVLAAYLPPRALVARLSRSAPATAERSLEAKERRQRASDRMNELI